MSEEKVLTVLVPAYNAGKYIKTNLDSLCIPQLLPGLEVLIVNDGSTDDTREIAKEYVSRYPQTFRLINKENGGHGSCINMGISEAVGYYFKVVDADDWVVADEFTKLVDFLEDSSSDIVSSGFLWAYDRGEPDINDFETKAEITEPFKGVQYGREYRFDDVAEKLYIKMHNLTLKTDILRQMTLAIDEHCYYVDYEYVTYPVPYVQTVTFLDNSVYRYRIGNKGQSVDIDQMIAHQDDVDRVLGSLLRFYDMLDDVQTHENLHNTGAIHGGSASNDKIPCSVPKRRYISGMAARLVATKVKIYLCEPESDAVKHELMNFDAMLKKDYPEIYRTNINSAVKMLRGSGFHLYKTAARAAKKQYDVTGE